MSTYDLSSATGCWTATLEVLSDRKATGKGCHIYRVRVRIETAQGNVSEDIVEHDSVSKFDPDWFRMLCALRSANLDDRSRQELVESFK